MIQWLVGKEEGPNTFWGKTVFQDLETASKHTSCVYRENDGFSIEILLATEEGPNTKWNDFDPSFDSVSDIKFFHPPADSRSVLRVKPKK